MNQHERVYDKEFSVEDRDARNGQVSQATRVTYRNSDRWLVDDLLKLFIAKANIRLFLTVRQKGSR